MSKVLQTGYSGCGRKEDPLPSIVSSSSWSRMSQRNFNSGSFHNRLRQKYHRKE